MSETECDILAPYPRAWRQSLAEATVDLAAAIESGMPRDELENAAPVMTARQRALLWVVSLLMAPDAAPRQGPVTLVPGKESHPPWPEGASSRRLAQVLAAIERASASGPTLRLAVEAITRRIRAIDTRGTPMSRAPQRVITLLEYLWAATDGTRRRHRGGYFTPPPLVGFIVRSVDHLLREELDVAEGLASERELVRVIDPACGGGAFLLGVVDYLRGSSAQSPIGSRWHRLAQRVLPARLVGVDIMPACCGATEILLETQLGAPWFAHCGNILEDIEYSRSLFSDGVPVIVGNPPYANFGRRNRGSWIRQQLADYTAELDEKKHNLADDFIKFLRWGQYWIDQAGCGILAMVTNNTYLTGLTHRSMRASLAASFDRIHVLDLHGSAKKRERTPDGARDENVFDVQQGVAIGLFVKRRRARRTVGGPIWHAASWGSRQQKLAALARSDVTTVTWHPLETRAPFHFFEPRQMEDEGEYRQWPRLDEIFAEYVSGVQTKRDALFVGFTPQEVEERMRRFLDQRSATATSVELPAWLARRVPGVSYDAQRIQPYMVAPWDVRWVYYEPRLLGRARYRVLRHLDGSNTALVFMRQATGPHPYDHVLATRVLVSDRVFYSAHGAPFVAPLHVWRTGQRVTNLQPEFRNRLAERLRAGWDDAGGAAGERSFTSYDVFHWMYAVLHSPRYRQRYRGQLGVEFPRLPWPPDFDAFRALARVGMELTETHCAVIGDRPPSAASETGLPGGTFSSQAVVERPRWTAPGTLHLNREAIWPESVEEAVWQHRVGGYSVLPRWLRQRAQRSLSETDRQQLQRIVESIRTTLRLAKAVDGSAW